jgi:hypothetical protein
MSYTTRCIVRKDGDGYKFEGGDLDKLDIFSKDLSALVDKTVIVEYIPRIRTVSVLTVTAVEPG